MHTYIRLSTETTEVNVSCLKTEDRNFELSMKTPEVQYLGYFCSQPITVGYTVRMYIENNMLLIIVCLVIMEAEACGSSCVKKRLKHFSEYRKNVIKKAKIHGKEHITVARKFQRRRQEKTVSVTKVVSTILVKKTELIV